MGFSAPFLGERNTHRINNAQKLKNNYLLTYDSYGPVHNRFNRGEWITWASWGEVALDTPGPLNAIELPPLAPIKSIMHRAIRISGQ